MSAGMGREGQLVLKRTEMATGEVGLLSSFSSSMICAWFSSRVVALALLRVCMPSVLCRGGRGGRVEMESGQNAWALLVVHVLRNDDETPLLSSALRSRSVALIPGIRVDVFMFQRKEEGQQGVGRRLKLALPRDGEDGDDEDKDAACFLVRFRASAASPVAGDLAMDCVWCGGGVYCMRETSTEAFFFVCCLAPRKRERTSTTTTRRSQSQPAHTHTQLQACP